VACRLYCPFFTLVSLGVMVYDRFIIDKPPGSPGSPSATHRDLGQVCTRLYSERRCPNDHHGIGFKLGWLMPELYGPAWPVMQGIKDAVDPQGIMNPGKLGFIRRA
jgi:alkyldihydroxyacetonephosphate synthase